MQRLLIVIVQLLLLTSLANSQSTNTQSPNPQSALEAVRGFGLLGAWAVDCRQPASPANAHASFALNSEGVVELRNSFGPDYDEMVYRIVDARRVGNFRLAMHEILTTDDRIVLDNVTLKAADRIRTWSSRFADGSATLVEDGLLYADEGHETGWMVRCDERRAGSANSVDWHRRL